MRSNLETAQAKLIAALRNLLAAKEALLVAHRTNSAKKANAALTALDTANKRVEKAQAAVDVEVRAQPCREGACQCDAFGGGGTIPAERS